MSFGENVWLVVITTALAGFVVPVVKSFMDQRHFQKQRAFEADIVRQSKVIEGRTVALAKLADLLWTYHYLADRAAYCGAHQEGDLSSALSKFSSDGWDVLARTRALIGSLRWCTPRQAHVALVEGHSDWADAVNSKMGELEDKLEAAGGKWEALHLWFISDSQEQLDSLLESLADNYGLPGGD